MFATIIAVGVLLGLQVFQIVLWAILLRVGLRWAKVDRLRTREIIVATASAWGASFALALVLYLPSVRSETQAILLGCLRIVVVWSAPILIIGRIFHLGIARSIRAWLPTLLSPLSALAVVVLFLKPFVCEAFVTPTNAMAPTLLGKHLRGVCPECGEPNFCTPPRRIFDLEGPTWMICGNFHERHMTDLRQDVFAGDRFFVSKLVSPQRWDPVVFRFPEDPSHLYVMRLVGLPGETIHIEDGCVCADGRRLEPPASLAGITYVSEFPGWPSQFWGSSDRPAALGQDEYFVLGDFSVNAKDSRHWDIGAPGHPPYAVPESHLVGVVTLVYWPPRRWRVLR